MKELNFLFDLDIKAVCTEHNDLYETYNDEEENMKKTLGILAIVLATMSMVGCGNSPDGDKQRLSSTTISPKVLG